MAKLIDNLTEITLQTITFLLASRYEIISPTYPNKVSTLHQY
jgi:hypothetical protein